ncbi:hypothetical protein [Anaerotignum sp.]|uniref:hypothetical protein n=3 Tax=Anaerotignum sp. TaxID=2039241 RepID=UPI002A90A1EF|nr:hypothetical protein [Anaerotignum sp.]MCI7656514.1 hypothetical protein [Clostridia bacterium]MDY5416052.1 hypothetical protein [Anaerotignum sp.]
MKEFLRLLAPLRHKLMAERFLKWFIYGETAAGILCLAVVVLSKFWTEIPALSLCGVFVLLGLLTALTAAFSLRKVTEKETAEAADALGGAERMITTMELLGKGTQNPVEEMAVADGFAKAKEMDFAKLYRMCLPVKVMRVLALVVVLTIGAGFVPVLRDKEAEVYANAQLERIEQVKKEETPELSKEEKKVFLEAAKALEKDLKTAKTKKAAEEAVRKAQQNMKQLEKESVPKDLKELAETLKQEESTAALSEALEQGDEAAISQAMEQLLQKMAAMDKGQAAALAQQLAEAAENISDEELQEALKALEEALENGADPSEAGEAVKNALLSQAQVNSALRSSLQKLNRNVGQQSLAKKVESGSESTGGEGQGGEGQGSEGQGNGGKTTNGGNGGTGNGTGGQGRGFGHTEPEKIYTRSAAGKDGYDAQLKGTDSEEGQTTVTEHRTMGQAGTSVPYDTVYGQYRNEAMETLENSSVPYGMRELVSDYFATLER